MTADISRNAFRPEQRYTGLVFQQGRIPLDSDLNDGGAIEEALIGQVVSDVICTRGSPDAGFTIGQPVIANGAIDFPIAAGSFYLGGVCVQTDAATFAGQPDWLTQLPADLAWTPQPAGQTRTDLVWLSGWEQVVTATEDSELFERALGGPDTAARKRVMWRVNILEGVGADCATAFGDLVTQQFPGGTLDPDGAEIVSGGALTVGFTQLEPTDDLCRPAAQAGFLGARNEAFRVQVTTPGRYVWGRDNAAPLYRVQITKDDNNQNRRLTFLTLPRDEFGWPLSGMTVELLHWGALLANHEKAAEANGLLLTVATGFSPDKNNSLDVTTDLTGFLTDWNTWLATPAGQAALQPLDQPTEQQYLYLRVWTGGGANNQPDNAFQPGVAQALGDTGLTLTFANNAMAGDYWVIAARPNTPSRVTPWSLLTGAPPAGPRRLVAPLALITTAADGSISVSDCRHTFRPLCEVGACCRVTVGDGVTSFGDVDTIQAAVDKLQATGGEICIHPGVYREQVVMSGCQNLLITGCGRETVWTTAQGQTDPLLTLSNCQNIHVRRLHMDAPTVEAIHGENPSATETGLKTILIEDVAFHAADWSAIVLSGGPMDGGFVIRRCRITLTTISEALGETAGIGEAPAIFLSGEILVVEHCRIVAEAERRTRLAAGGIQIGGGSSHILIRENLIRGGNGNGITLGSILWIAPVVIEAVTNKPAAANLAKKSFLTTWAGVISIGGVFTSTDNGCITTNPNPGTPPGGGSWTPESAGPVIDVRIFDNEIREMGYSGVATIIFSGLGTPDLPDAIVVEQIEITHNRIVGCVLNEIVVSSGLEWMLAGWGGIALSVCIDGLIRDNLITDNGISVDGPVNGVFLALGEDIRIERNEVGNNGAADAKGVALFDARDGIHISLLLPTLQPVTATNAIAFVRPRPAPGGLVVSQNIVGAPVGRALKAILLAPALVHGNRFTGACVTPVRTLTAGFTGAAQPTNLTDYEVLEAVLEVLGGDVVNLISLAAAADISALAQAFGGAAPALTNGALLVNDNQITLTAGPQQSGAVSSVLLLGGDDVSFDDNQAVTDPSVAAVLVDAIVVGTTVRIEANRIQEAGWAGLSLLSFGFLNNTSNNQTTHCIFASGPTLGLVNANNRVLLQLFNKGFCEPYTGAAASLSKTADVSAGLQA
jgi:hypothetical protein